MSFDDLEDKLDAAREGTGGQSDDDYEDRPRVKLTPVAAIGGTIRDVYFTGDTSAEQNIRGDGYGGDFAFVLEDPEVVKGQLWEALGRDEAEDNLISNLDPSFYPFDVDRNNDKPTRDFRVVDEQGEDAQHISDLAKKVDGSYEQVGIEIYKTEFPATPAEFDDALTEHDAVDVFVSGQAGRIMMTGVDVTLTNSAYIDDEGNRTKGLIEYPRDYGTNDWSPSGDSKYPRGTRQPQLHPELEGEEIVLYQHFGDLDLESEEEAEEDEDEDESGFRKHYGDVLWASHEETPILTQGSPLEPRPDLVDDRATFLQFHEPEGGWSSGPSSDSDEDDSGSFDFDELDGGTTDESEADMGVDDLDPDTRTFINDAADYASGVGIDDAFDDFNAMVETAIENGEIDEIDPSTARNLVEEEMSA